jgi:para-nitrobenzyl esterase
VNVDEIVDAMLNGGHAYVWTYRFNWDESPKVPFNRSGRKQVAQAMGDGWTSYALEGGLRMAELRQYAGDQTLIQVIMIYC